MRAILLRHAKSDWGDPALGDHARPLNARGRAAAPVMGRWIASFGPIDRVLVSDAARTLETWDRLALPGEAEPRPDLYLAPASTYLSVLPDTGTAMVIGHMDGIGMAAAEMVEAPPDHPAFARYPTCACTVIDWDGPPAWRRGRVAGFAVPRDLMP